MHSVSVRFREEIQACLDPHINHAATQRDLHTVFTPGKQPIVVVCSYGKLSCPGLAVAGKRHFGRIVKPNCCWAHWKNVTVFSLSSVALTAAQCNAALIKCILHAVGCAQIAPARCRCSCVEIIVPTARNTHVSSAFCRHDGLNLLAAVYNRPAVPIPCNGAIIVSRPGVMQHETDGRMP